MAQWQIEREAREAEERKGYARFRVYARDIAAALGDEFTLEPARGRKPIPAHYPLGRVRLLSDPGRLEKQRAGISWPDLAEGC